VGNVLCSDLEEDLEVRTKQTLVSYEQSKRHSLGLMAEADVGVQAKLTADVIAGEVIEYGSVKGDVHGKGRIEIKKDGSVNGDLTAPHTIIEDGEYFKGSIEIEKSAEKEGDKNLFSRTASAPATPKGRVESRSI